MSLEWAFSIGATVKDNFGFHGKVLTRFRNSKGENLYVVAHSQAIDHHVIMREDKLEADIIHPGKGDLTGPTKGFFVPANGLKPNHWYKALVAFNASNPVHEALFYSGLCQEGDKLPGNYAILINPFWEPAACPVYRPRYVRVIEDLGVLLND